MPAQTEAETVDRAVQNQFGKLAFDAGPKEPRGCHSHDRLDDEFFNQIRQTAVNAPEGVTALNKLMFNVGGSVSRKRRLVISSFVLRRSVDGCTGNICS